MPDPQMAFKARVGEAVRRCRMMSGLSQSELAGKVNIRSATLSNIERGESLPDLSTVWRIADELQVGIDELLGRLNFIDAEPMPPAVAVDETESPGTDARVRDLERRVSSMQQTLTRIEASLGERAGSPGRRRRPQAS